MITNRILKNKKGSKIKMKLKGLSALGSALMLSISSLLFVALPGVAHATSVTLYWCNESASTADFNTASNWNTDSDCSSGTQEVPVSGDSLVFDNTNLANGVEINNDITGLALDSITFQGTNSNLASFEITGDGISLSGGLTDTSNSSINSWETDIALTADQTFSTNANSGFLNIGTLGGSNIFDIGSYNLTLSSPNAGIINFDSPLSGSGQLNTDPNGPGTYQINAASPNYTGTTTLYAGQMNIFYPNALGTGMVTVVSGSTINGIFSDTNDVMTNPMTLGGDGYSANGSPQGALNFNNDCPNGSTCLNDGTVTLSGPISLTSDTTIGASTTTDVTGSVSGGYSLTLEDGYPGPLNVDGTSVGSGSTSTPSSSTTTTTPKTPDTGSALTSAKVGLPLLASLLAAGGLFILSKRINHLSAK